MFRLPTFLLAAVLIGLSFILATAQVDQRQAIVKTTDGRTFEGALVAETTDSIILSIAGIRTPISREDIDSVEYIKSTMEQYKAKRAKIADDDLEARYDLAYWLYEQRAYQLALRELQQIKEPYKKAHPDETNLETLERIVLSRIKMEKARDAQKPPARPDQDRPDEADAGEDAAPGGGRMPDPRTTRLKDEQINLIKVYEIDLEGRPSGITVPPKVLNEAFDEYASDPATRNDRRWQNRMLGAPGYVQLQYLFDLRAREYYDQVIIRGDPAHLRQFRTEVHNRYVLNYCATADCHGGPDAKGIFLFRAQPNSDETVYTNYYILHEYEDAKGFMIDRQQPERSYLVHYGLPRENAAFAHPEAPGWRPHFRNAEDRNAENVRDWIRSLPRTDPNYPITYEPPMPKPVEKEADGETEEGTGDQS